MAKRKVVMKSLLTDEQKKEIDKRIDLHKSGKSRSFTWKETKSMILAQLKNKSKSR